MTSKWTERAERFMKQTIRGGCKRHVSSRSQYHGVAFSLAHDHGMLAVEHLYRLGGQVVVVYEVTDKGRREFAEVAK